MKTTARNLQETGKLILEQIVKTRAEYESSELDAVANYFADISHSLAVETLNITWCLSFKTFIYIRSSIIYTIKTAHLHAQMITYT